VTPSAAASRTAIGSGSLISGAKFFYKLGLTDQCRRRCRRQLGWAKLSEGGRNINLLTSDRLTDLGGGATFYSTLVEVERADATSTVTEG